ncbi:hypothetical protein QQS21_011664 [Conoideocrella luteorostrata]|uniref:EKC/KEOPS complex subunit BUD32 n=1 Tax=Conoideocrella luteorostrata TaxID=1105319 RepID=A0AAJ0FN56_9HYPO|nr:hypothetical protein QQS21_011664 [Conoideocrella luteorostrata]
MALSEEQVNTIVGYPLGDTLDGLIAKLRSLKEPQEEAWHDDVATLLGALLSSKAAYNLSLSDGMGNVADKLFVIQKQVRGASLSFSHFRHLIDAVVDKSLDTDIWTAVINLIEAVSPSTPPPGSIIKTGFGTPVKSSSSRLGNSETRDIIERELFYEIKDCTHRDVPGFFEKYFDVTKWTKKQQKMLKSILTNHDGTKWKTFPADPWEGYVWEWLTTLEKMALAGASYVLHSNKTATEFKSRKGQMDIFFQKARKPRGRRFEYKHILVVGEHKRSHNTGEFKACLLQLTRHVRSMFDDQPMRWFIHAFTIKATTMELWVFDRSGAYSSGEFDVHREPDKFARALVAYATMDNEAMGLDRSIEWKDSHRYMTVERADGKDERVELKDLLVKQRAVVCRGTTCFSTNKGVAKFSWRSAKRQPSEVRHLQTARDKGVQGIARLVGHREITTIADLRAGLDFSKNTQHPFQSTAHDRSDGHGHNRPQGGLESSGSGSSSRKRKSLDKDTRPSTRRRSSSQKSKPPPRQAHAHDDQPDREADKRTKPSLYTPDQNDPYENRILSCLITSPAGQVISDFKSARKLLEALRDAIRAHQSLYTKGRILHRDISSNNIIITEPSEPGPGGFKGMLIDLDLAKERDGKPSGARNQTGTMQFMAIEVLRGVDHTYRHDLESFFYVLLWMCARCAWDSEKKLCGDDEAKPIESDLRTWEVGNFKQIAKAKAYHMSVGGLEEIMDEFPEGLDNVKPLCLRIRRILFPLDKDERMSFGTPAGDPDQLYKPIIAAYDEVINNM